jgi:hypothetical protein
MNEQEQLNFDAGPEPAEPEAPAQPEAPAPERRLNAYEQRQEERRERLQERADKHAAKGDQLYQRAHSMAEVIPFGQPILVGHHSEKRDRNYRERIHNTFGKAFGEMDYAKDLKQRADAVGSAGVSSDDPDAVAKLTEQVEELEAAHALMKRCNEEYRKVGTAALEALPPVLLERAKRYMEHWPGGARVPFPNLAGSSTNIRRVKERIELLRREEARRDETPEPASIQAAGFVIEEDRDLNRMLLRFPGRPPDSVCSFLRQRGWRWARTWGAWSRQLNQGARHEIAWSRPIIEQKIAEAS